MTVTSKDLFEAYTKAERKIGWIQREAKRLGITRSQVIAELLKSGYKLEEIRRSDKGNYDAGVNKYNQWVKDGSPEQTYEVPEVAPEAREKMPYKKPAIITEEMALNPPTEEMVHEVEKNASKKPEPVLVSEPEPVKEKPKSVLITSPKKKNDEMSPEDVAKLKFRIVELENENRKAADKIREFSEYKQKYEELLDQYDIATLDNETAQNGLVEEYKKRVEVEKKLRKAERIICDRIYEDMPDEAE